MIKSKPNGEILHQKYKSLRLNQRSALKQAYMESWGKCTDGHFAKIISGAVKSETQRDWLLQAIDRIVPAVPEKITV